MANGSLMKVKSIAECSPWSILQYFWPDSMSIELIARSDAGVVIDNEPHLSSMCKTSLLFAPLAVRVQAGCYAFPYILHSD